MRDPAFRQVQQAQRHAAHVAAINRLVDELRDPALERWVPYVPAYHGGVAARVLLLFQDPGPKTSPKHDGSGFVGCENDDPSAELLAQCLDAAGLAAEQVVPWNAYPWFVSDQRRLTMAMLDQGLEPLHRLLGLLPQLVVVITFGATARTGWHRYRAAHPDSAARYRYLATLHTSRRGITNGWRQPKADGVRQVVAALSAAAAILGQATVGPVMDISPPALTMPTRGSKEH